MTAQKKGRARRSPADATATSRRRRQPPASGDRGATSAAHDFLREFTGRDRAWWFACVQQAVSDSGTKTGGDHDIADPLKFMYRVVTEVVHSLPSQGAYDPNMRSALVTSYVLGLWFMRLFRAKCFHPARPLDLRREAYAHWLDAVREFSMLAVDERDDYTFMPQEWDNPFLPGARSGKFV